MISIGPDDQVSFLGQRSSVPEREYLRYVLHMVHVTGLKVNLQGIAYHIGDKVSDGESACWNISNQITAVTTSGGEVWIRYGRHPLTPEDERYLLLHNGCTGRVPLSGSTEMTFDHALLLARFNNPDAGLIFPA
ncbi:MAG: hypothetical protein C3F02_02140 [Parcubacteria group bacterium]|nr:MAG: hypothetical protein C3F02_02140 [Parcubacteria group bacterium]